MLSSTILSLPPEVIENFVLKYLSKEDIKSFARFGSLVGDKKLHDIAIKVERSRGKFQSVYIILINVIMMNNRVEK